MRFLLDTNVLSETRRPEPDRRVLEWLDRLDEDRAFISVVTLAEIRRGVALMQTGRRRDALAHGSPTTSSIASPAESCPSMKRPLSLGAI